MNSTRTEQTNVKIGGGNRYATQSFQNSLLNTSTRSAEEIVPFLMETIDPKSVVDIGCGVGAWLKVFRDKGSLPTVTVYFKNWSFLFFG